MAADPTSANSEQPNVGSRRTSPWLASLPKELRSITTDQLTTLVSLYETRSFARTAADLRREQSSVQKQLATLNAHFLKLCGEPLADSEPRKDLVFFPTGQRFAEMSKDLLREWSTATTLRRRQVGRSLVIGVTAFVLDVVDDAWGDVRRRLEAEGITVTTHQIRTAELLSKLRTNEVDVALGGVLLDPRSTDLGQPDIDFLPWASEPFVVVTNYPAADLPGPVTPEVLKGLQLVASESGIVADFLSAWYGSRYRDELRVADAHGDVLFNLSLLSSNTVIGCTLVPEYLVTSAPWQMRGLRVLRLTAPSPAFPDLRVVAGVLARRADRRHFDEDHPINLVWRHFEHRLEGSRTMDQASRRSPTRR